MSPLRPPVPQALDVVAASEVGEVIARTDREFVDLEARVAALRTEAAEAEQLAESEGVDPNSSTWTMVRLQRFLDGLRDEAQRDSDAVVAVARQRARVRVAEVREASPPVAPVSPAPLRFAADSSPSDASPFAPQSSTDVAANGSANGATNGAGADTAAIFLPRSPAVTPPPPFEGSAPVASAARVLTIDATPTTAPAPAPAVNGSASYAGEDFWSPARTPTEPVAAAPPAPVVVPLVVAAPPVETPPVPTPPVPTPPVAPVAQAPVIAAPPVMAAPPRAVVAPAAPATKESTRKADRAARKAAEAEAKAKETAGATPRPSLLSRLPITAILEVLAVLLILVFILLRLS